MLTHENIYTVHGYAVRLATAYAKDEAASNEDTADEGAEGADAEGETFTIPEDFSELNDEDLSALHTQAVENFDALYGDGEGITDETYSALSELTEGIEALAGEIGTRETAAAERAEQARELATRVKPEAEHNADTEGTPDEDEDSEVEDDGDGPDEDEDEDSEDESSADTVTAAAEKPKRKATKINMASIRSKGHGGPPSGQSYSKAKSMKEVAFGDDAKGADWNSLSTGLDRKLASFNSKQYAGAQRRGQHLREQHSIGVFHKPVPEALVASSSDPEHVEGVMSAAVDQTRLQGGSLVAAGGWGAPSETLYDFLELEARDGLLSLPEITVTRGGIHYTPGIDFRDIFSNTGFDFTESDDEAGTYPGEDGDKPNFHVEMPDFTEARLDVAGVYITAGLLASRGYPEVIQRVLRGAMVAHDHKMSANKINAIADDSDEVTMPTGQVGAVAPVLSAIDLQVNHYRAAHRLPMSATLEAVFPFWTQGLIKSDLARRNGIEFLAVTDQMISGWFAQRGVAPQFVYNWQGIDSTDAGNFTAWPSELSFLLYAAGTWVAGTSDIITLDTVYDSLTLGQNNYTALFTEEGWLVAKRGSDSRLVTVEVNANGGWGAPQVLDHQGAPVEVNGGGVEG